MTTDVQFIAIEFNGNQEQVVAATTILDLLQRAKIESRMCAVEVNLEIVPRSEFASFRVSPGDRVEVVTLVGGG